MPSPFPGMDPYIERPEIWPDFQLHFVVSLSAALRPLLRPAYVSLIQHRCFLVESPGREEWWHPYIQILKPTAADRPVTVIEVLSPDDKTAGPARASYLRQREEFWSRGVNLVEIDLLRMGDLTVRISAEQTLAFPAWHYLVVVSRPRPMRQDIYAFPLTERLPTFAIPLTAYDRGVVCDLQAVFARCWDEGPYPELLRYDSPPPRMLADDDVAWCVDVLRQAGLRPPLPAQPS